VLTKVSGSKWKVTGRRRPLHNEKLHDVCSSPNIFRAIEPKRTNWVEARDACGGEEKLIQSLVGEPEGNRLPARSRRKH